MNYIQLFLICLCCCFSSFVFSQDNNKETIKITGTADTLLVPNYYDFYIMKVSDNDDDATMYAQNKLIKQMLSKNGIDTSKIILTSVMNNEYNTAQKKHNYNLSINFRSFSVNNIATIKTTLAEKEYKVIRCNGQLSDSLVDKEAINQLLLAGAIRNGRKKANEVANELGMKSIKFVSFNEGKLTEGRSESSIYGIGGCETGKIKLTKEVTLVYRPEENK